MTERNLKLLNKETLGIALRRKFGKNVKVNSFEVSLGSKKGDNFTSDIYRVTVNYEIDNKEGRCSLIVKYMLDREEARKLLEVYNLSGKEFEMYTKILPKISDELNEKCSPECYYVTDNKEAFFLEDMKVAGYDVADRQIGLNLQQSQIFLEKLGKFHAASAILAEKEPNLYKTFDFGMFKEVGTEFMDQILIGNYMLLIDVVEKWDGFEKILEKLRKIIEKSKESMLKCVMQPGKIKVLNHGDCWTNNVMFKGSEDLIFVSIFCFEPNSNRIK